jgi:peptidoglycan hydrolase-like protein with peptidoglycan-binding domain
MVWEVTMKSVWGALGFSLVGIWFAGCADPGIVSRTVTIGSMQALATSADLRLIVLRDGPLSNSSRPQILCSEPSPDVSKALATALALTASAKTPSGVEASGSVSRTTAEQVTVLAGRTAAVVALRDGLYKACEAYANGIVGDSAYALILNRYGDLLVTLMLGESAGAAPAIPATTEQSQAKASGSMSPAEAISNIHHDYSSAGIGELLRALFVSCLTEFDPSRRAAAARNPALDLAMCSSFLTRIGSIPPTSPVEATTVKKVQMTLNQLGSKLPTDGILATDTKTALMEFQRTHGLPQTGQIDAPTLALLFLASP